jgi:hypothetical protein
MTEALARHDPVEGLGDGLGVDGAVGGVGERCSGVVSSSRRDVIAVYPAGRVQGGECEHGEGDPVDGAPDAVELEPE